MLDERWKKSKFDSMNNFMIAKCLKKPQTFDQIIKKLVALSNEGSAIFQFHTCELSSAHLLS